MPDAITPKQLAELQAANKSVELIDVRTPVEFRDVHVDFARNVPLDQLDAQAIRAQRSGSESEPVYVFAVPEVAESRPATSLPMQT